MVVTPLISTRLQPGVSDAKRKENRFNGFTDWIRHGLHNISKPICETVKTVFLALRIADTRLKPGANERGDDHANSLWLKPNASLRVSH